MVVTDRETTQSSFDAVRYWASGLKRAEAEAYAAAAEAAHDRAHELQVMRRAARRGVRFG